MAARPPLLLSTLGHRLNSFGQTGLVAGGRPLVDSSPDGCTVNDGYGPGQSGLGLGPIGCQADCFDGSPHSSQKRLVSHPPTVAFLQALFAALSFGKLSPSNSVNSSAVYLADQPGKLPN